MWQVGVGKLFKLKLWRRASTCVDASGDSRRWRFATFPSIRLYSSPFPLQVSFDSSVGRAWDCNWFKLRSKIPRSLVRSRFEGLFTISYRFVLPQETQNKWQKQGGGHGARGRTRNSPSDGLSGQIISDNSRLFDELTYENVFCGWSGLCLQRRPAEAAGRRGAVWRQSFRKNGRRVRARGRIITGRSSLPRDI